MDIERKITPLQSAADALETARVALIEKLTGEATANKQNLAGLQQEAMNLNTKRIDLMQKFNFQEAKKVSEEIPAIQAKIKECEIKVTGFEKRLEDARQCRAPELYGLAFKENQEMRSQHVQNINSAESAFTELVTDRMRDAVKAIANSNPDQARRVVLGAFQLDQYKEAT